jgi:hypothetical protein
VHSQLIDAQGAPAGGAVSIAATGRFAGVTALGGGGFAVEYEQPGVVLVQLLDASGALAGAPVVVRTQAQVQADPRWGPHDGQQLAGGAGVYAGVDGGFIATYRESSNVHIPGSRPMVTHAQRHDALGHPVGAPVVVGDDTSTLASTPAGGLIVSDIYYCPCAGTGRTQFSVYDASLQRLGAAPTGSIGLDTGDRQNAAALANGTYVAIWTVTYASPGNGPMVMSQVGQVQGQVFAMAPGPHNVTPFLAFPSYVGAGARVTPLAGGGFLLSWGTSAQAFNANAQPVSQVVQILDGSIAPTPEGGFVVVAQVGSQLVEQEYAAGP